MRRTGIFRTDIPHYKMIVSPAGPRSQGSLPPALLAVLNPPALPRNCGETEELWQSLGAILGRAPSLDSAHWAMIEYSYKYDKNSSFNSGT
jgi:hypothetical protein